MVNKSVKGLFPQRNTFFGEKIYYCTECKESFIAKSGISEIFTSIKCPHCGSTKVTDKTIKY